LPQTAINIRNKARFKKVLNLLLNMLSDKEIKQIREELESCKRPVFFFHDDQDGLASFLLLYRYVKEGRGIVLKAFPELKAQLAKKAIDYGADKVFILDIALVEQEFIDEVKVPVIWIDHHTPVARDRVKYYNPRLKEESLNVPAAYLCYQVVQQDMWIAMTGCLGDWYIPDFLEDFKKKYPDLMPEKISVGDFLFKSRMGILVKLFSFNLKENTSEVVQSMKILTRADNPYEILNQETPKGRFVYKKYEKINKAYEELKERILKQKTDGKLLVFTYTEDKLSLTKDLSNELLYMFPNSLIVLGRDKSGEMRCSIRTGLHIDLLQAVKKALIGIEGYGGGHEHACGAAIKKHDFNRFIENLGKEI